MSIPTIRVSVPSGKLAARTALAELKAGLAPLALDVEETSTVELVIAEVLNNICEHAYEEAEDAGPIDVTCTHGEDGLRFVIMDQGHAMPDGKTPLGMEADLDVDVMDLPEGGFGWFLIQDLAKDVVYRRVGDANRLWLRIAVAM
ncbi:MAG: ATP-binding protein [Pseudomonadota bacterium]